MSDSRRSVSTGTCRAPAAADAPGVRAVGRGEEADAERREQLRHPRADRAEPDQAHGLPFELDELPARPLAPPACRGPWPGCGG